MISFFKNKPYLLILGLILIIGIFFRTYDLVGRAHFDHDSDLFSWVVKDIVVDHHFRLIGQLTSAPGIFIGPFFYYLLIPFFILFRMDPIAASIPITIIGVLTIISYYVVFSKLFNTKIGLIISFVYSILIPNIDFDRRVVPSTPTNIWVVWYFYIIVMISRGNHNVFPLLGVLIGLIWHIHIALIPTLLAIPFAIIVSKKIPTKKQTFYFFVSLFITSLPLIIFELRHSFSQTLSLIGNFSSEHGGEVGIAKLLIVLNMVSKNINSLFLSPQNLSEEYKGLFTVLLSLIILSISFWKKLISKKETIPLLAWILGVVIFFTISSSLISEYYFYSIQIIFLAFTSLALFYVYKLSRLMKILVMILFTFLLIKNLSYYINQYIYHKGYIEKKEVVRYIKEDMLKKAFPCIGISYITTPGENVGFRYLLFLNNINLIHPSLDIPVYNIVIPEELSQEKGKIKFGHIGVIPPTHIPPKETIQSSCQIPNTNLTDSMFGFVN